MDPKILLEIFKGAMKNKAPIRINFKSGISAGFDEYGMVIDNINDANDINAVHRNNKERWVFGCEDVESVVFLSRVG